MSAPTLATVTEDDIDALLELDEEEFAEVIAGTLGAPSSHEDWQCLIHPSVLGRTITAIGDLIQVVQNEAGRINTRLNDHSDGHARLGSDEYRRFQRARADLVSRKVMLAARLAQAKEARRVQYIAEQAERGALKAEQSEKDRAHIEHLEAGVTLSRNAVRVLACAIQRHRLDAIASGLAPEPHDRALWSVLDRVVVPLGKGQATVTELLGQGLWTEQPEDAAAGCTEPVSQAGA